MATNKRFGKRLPEWVRREDAPGTRIDSGPFIGYVKNNFDPIRSGRLQVWIPELGGSETTPSSWRTVSYASPFAGTTYQDSDSKNNKFSEVPHSYGMWAVPPDIGCQVICTFIVGDPNRGYWFACINTDLSHHMMPGLASGQVDSKHTDPALQSVYGTDSNWPVVEFNENNNENVTPGFIKNTKPAHEPQTKTLIKQGLDRDRIRGAVTSSSQRESPSTVFGISTPGRPVNDPAENPNFQAKMLAGTLTVEDVKIRARKGGHTFIMDDGDQTGSSNLVRLRTAGGHQILMNDSEQVLYIANSNGSAWLEFTSGGHINMFSAGGVNLRTKGNFNVHSDADINLNSKGSVNINAGAAIASQTSNYTVKSSTFTAQAGTMGLLSTGAIKVQGATGSFKTGGDLVLKGSKIFLNTSTPGDVSPVPALKIYTHNDSSEAANGQWSAVTAAFESITTAAPAHEPWSRQTVVSKSMFVDPLAPVVREPVQSSICANQTTEVTLDPGPKSATGQQVKYPAAVAFLSSADAPAPEYIKVSGVNGLLAAQVKALMVQIGYAESGRFKNARIDYAHVDLTLGRIGGYQINGALLKEYGYVAHEYDIFNTFQWLGKDDINSHTEWLNSPGIQEKVMELVLRDYYRTMTRQQGILQSDDICAVAGMLAVAYFFRNSTRTLTTGIGTSEAKFWRQQGTQTDSQGTPGSVPYNQGRYAIDILAAQGVKAVNPAAPAAVPAAPKPAATSSTPAVVDADSASGIDPASVINFAKTGSSGDRAHYDMLQPQVRSLMEKMADEFKQKKGRKITLTSAVRTLEEQTAIYQAWLRAGGKPGVKSTVYAPGYGNLYMPAKPNPNAPHVRGVAFDLAKADIRDLISLGLLDKYKFKFPFPIADPVHIQYKG